MLKKEKKISQEAIEKMKLTKKLHPYQPPLREKNPNWKGGKSGENDLIRKSKEYKLWRKAVFERDNWSCIWCGFHGYVEADHIKPFSLFPELRFAIDNGRTLCKPCHRGTDTFGFRKMYSKKTMKTPHQIADEMLDLSQAYSTYSGEMAKLTHSEAEHFKTNRELYKSDTACERAFLLTEEGIKMTVIKLKLKSLEKTMGANKVYLEVLANEARGLY